MIRLIWDFHGLDAKEIAKHHAKHLEEFALREKLEGASAGIETVEGGHCTAWIQIQETDMEVVRDALKPQRGYRV